MTHTFPIKCVCPIGKRAFNRITCNILKYHLSHYLNQSWDVVNRTLRNKLQWNHNRNSYIFNQENGFANVLAHNQNHLKPKHVPISYKYIYIYIERERVGVRDRQTDRHTGRQTDRQTDKDRDRDRDRDTMCFVHQKYHQSNSMTPNLCSPLVTDLQMLYA